MDSGGSGGSQTSTSEPWSGQAPYLRGLFSRSNRDYTNRELAQVAPQSAYTQQAQDLTAERALGPNLTDQAAGLAGQTLSGDFLSGESNPYLQDQIRRSQQTTIDNFNEQVAPGIDSAFAGGGRYGSGAYAARRNRAEDTLTDSLADTAGQLAYQNYGDERGRQMQTLAASPALDQAGYAGLDRLAGVGADQDAYSQAQADLPYQNLQRHANIIYGSPTFGTTTGTQRQQQSSNPWAMGAGALMTMAPLMFSDERLKTDIKEVGELKTGETLYSYRYKGDKGGKIHFGPMAQELEKMQPETVHEVAGFKAVDYGQVAANQQPKAFW